MMISNNIRISNPTQGIKDFCKNNLVIDNPEFLRRLKLGKYLGNIPEKIALYKKDGNDLILPYGCQDAVFRLVGDEISVKDIEINTCLNKAEYNAKEVPLYDFQRKAVDSMCCEVCGILQSPTGSGKTQMGIGIITKLKMKALWITHTKDLLEQSKNRALQYIDADQIGTITSGKINIGSAVTFATIQTLAKIDLGQLRDTWGLIMVDECHRVAGSPTKLTQFYKVLDNLNAHYKMGLSATVHRADGKIKSTKAILGEVKYLITQEDVKNYTVPVSIHMVSTGSRPGRECLNWDGTIDYQKFLTSITNNTDRNNVIRDLISANEYKHILVLSDRVDHLHNLCNMLSVRLHNQAVIITGKTDKKTREASIEAMRKGEKTIMFSTYKLAAEGLDIPCLDTLIMATPIKDYAKVVQSIGRLSRKSEGKTEPIVYDLLDDSPYTIKMFQQRKRHYKKINMNMQ